MLTAVTVICGAATLHWPMSDMAHRYFIPMDDAFYYLKTAYNFWVYGVSTFDGVTHTNGYHPLWMLVCIVCALPFRLAGAYDYFPFGMSIFNLGLYAAAANVLFAVIRLSGLRPAIAATVAAVVFGLMPYPYVLNLLESTLLVFCMLLVVYYLQRCLAGTTGFRPLAFALFSLSVLLARLDAAIWLLLLYPALLLQFSFRRIVIAGLLLCLMAAPYFAYNHFVFGGVTPVSGAVKKAWTEMSDMEISGQKLKSPAQFWNARHDEIRYSRLRVALLEPVAYATTRGTMRSIQLKDSLPAPAGSIFAYLVAGVIAANTLLLALLWWRGRWCPTGGHLLLLNAVLLTLVFHLVLVFQYTFRMHVVFPWYLAVGVTAGMVAISVGMFAWWQLLPRRFCAGLAMLAAFWILTVGITDRLRCMRTHSSKETAITVFDNLGRWIRQNTPENARIMSWATGLIGYIGNRSITNMEGIISDRNVLRASLDFDPAAYWVEQGADYVVNHYRVFQRGLDTDWCKRPSWDFFNDLRIRGWWDFYPAFTVVYKTQTRESAGYVFEIDKPRLAALVGERDRLRAMLRQLAHIVPAESHAFGSSDQGDTSIPHTERYAMTGNLLHYDLQDAAVLAAPVHCYVKIYSSAGPASFNFSMDGQTGTATVPGNCRWAIIPLLDRSARFSLGSVIELTGLKQRPFSMKNPVETWLWVDEIYLVPEHAVPAYGAASEAYLEFCNRRGLPSDTSGGFSPGPPLE